MFKSAAFDFLHKQASQSSSTEVLNIVAAISAADLSALLTRKLT